MCLLLTFGRIFQNLLTISSQGLAHVFVMMILVYFILCRYMKGADSSSEKDGEGSQDVAESISAEQVGMSKTVRFLSSIVPSNMSNIAL